MYRAYVTLMNRACDLARILVFLTGDVEKHLATLTESAAMRYERPLGTLRAAFFVMDAGKETISS